MTRPGRDALLPAALAAVTFAPSVFARAFIRDDAYIVAENALLRAWSSLPTLLSTGYWEGAMGAGAPVQEYRPALMLSFFLNRQLLGAGPWGFRLVNVLLHAGVCAALYAALKRRLAPRAALAAAALFAVLPVHVEAVSYIAGRSEILVLLFLLLAWLDFEGPSERWRRGLLWQALALLSKEQAVLFPLFLAAADHVDGSLRSSSRRRLHLRLWGLTAASLALRFAVLGRPFHGGMDYFAGVPLLSKWLTVAKFWTLHYAAPMLTGLGLNADYSRPLFPDAGPGDAAAWLCLTLWLAAGAASLEALRRRKPAALLGAVFFLPLLPTSNLIIHLDTIGAERFLYTPSIAFCVLGGLAFARLPAGAALWAPLLAVFYAWGAVARQRVWRDELSYATATVRDNPVSAGARSAYGVEMAKKGRLKEAEESFKQAITFNRNHPAPYYNLGRLYLEQGRLEEAEAALAKLEGGDPDADHFTLRAVVAERRGKPADAARYYARALVTRPWDAVAHFNLGRLSLAAGHRALAVEHFERYLQLAPDAADAEDIRALLRTLK